MDVNTQSSDGTSSLHYSLTGLLFWGTGKQNRNIIEILIGAKAYWLVSSNLEETVLHVGARVADDINILKLLIPI